MATQFGTGVPIWDDVSRFGRLTKLDSEGPIITKSPLMVRRKLGQSYRGVCYHLAGLVASH